MLKDSGNCLEGVYKLLMNSSYGSCIQRPITEENKIIDSDKMEAYICQNFNHIKSYTQIPSTNKFDVKVWKNIINHYSYPQVGTQVLSMSKRLMNRVIFVAEFDITDATPWYTDTDSMFSPHDKMPELYEAFERRYGYSINHKNLGGFHPDFKDADASDIFIALGKKSYLAGLCKFEEEGHMIPTEKR